MARLVRRLNRSLQRILGHFLGFEKGEFIVKKGKHEVKVPINICASTVWIKAEESVFDGCGQAPVNKVGYRLLHKEIVFFVEAATEYCKVEWYATEGHGDRDKWDRRERHRKGRKGRQNRKHR
ncbi:MAG: hypothetical protein DWQ19_09825 [Crenarchaeota archaeon]|nr:MAG: hypothetical protein DWQ19_09825 [Thermoproteota archaeon]